MPVAITAGGPAAEVAGWTTDAQLVRGYESMRLIREFELTIERLAGAARLPGFIHVAIGQEAIPAAVGLCLEDEDLIASTHRGHGDVISRGATIEAMFAEVLGRTGGTCGAKGGSMHVAEVARGVLGANGIVGASLGIAVGAALSQQIQGRRSVVVAYTGDGALANGVTHEALNAAALWRLPLIVVRADNQWALSTRSAEYQGMPDVVAFARSYGIAAELVDGNDLAAMIEAVARAVRRARQGDGPTFLNAATYRMRGHNTADTRKYRDPGEVERWAAQDPIARFLNRYVGTGRVSTEDVETIDERVRAKVAGALAWAEAQPEPLPSSAFEGLFSDPDLAARAIGPVD